MSVTDGLYYIAFTNPISKAVIGTTANILRMGSGNGNGAKSISKLNAPLREALPPLWRLAGHNRNFIRLAGISSAAAVILGAYGSHSIPAEKGEAKSVFDTANRFHFFHSIALMSVPLVRRPMLTGFLLLTGTALFSGLLYYRAFTDDKQFNRFAPVGGICLIAAWLSMAL